MTDSARTRLSAGARVISTPCGDGEMAWRTWGAGPAVVLLHGGHGSWTHWIRNIEALAADATVVVPDLPGMGDSSLPANPGAGESHVRTLRDGIHRVLPPGEPYTLVGFSLGATIGVRLAALDVPRVAALVLISAGGIGDRARLRLESVRSLVREEEIEAAHRRNLEILMVADPGVLDAETVRLQRDNIARARIEPTAIEWPTSMAAALAALPMAFTALYGERDATIAPGAEARREQLLQVRPDADVRIIPGAGHWAQYEAPREVNRVIRDRIPGLGQPAGTASDG